MVGRELQKIRPYGEDHQGLAGDGGGVVRADIQNNGRRIDGLKSWTVMRMMGKELV